MNWDDIAGHEQLKTLLKESISGNRISHAQLFTGAYGYGTLLLAIAFAKEILRKENEHSSSKVDHLNHLDLHFSFPVFKASKNGLSAQFFDEFREMMLKDPYSNNEDWNAILESENKQLSIYVEEIDEINILNASILGMHRSLDLLKKRPEFIIVDGNKFKPYGDIPYECIVKGDSKYLSIAAASVLAKTYRDAYMLKIHEEYPMYHWDKNKGYPTKEHREAIRKYGSSPYHRKTFQLLPAQLKLDL